MKAPIIISLNFTYKKPETDVWVLNFNDIPLPQKRIQDKQIIHLAPQSVGGNHKHPRTEWWIAIGELELVWQDEQQALHTEHMNPNGKILLIEMPPNIPHAVRNTSPDQRGVLLEWADGKMENVEVIKIV
jgi:hypothetical protein